MSPTPANAALRFFITWWVCPSISVASIFPFYGLIGICPDTNTILPTTVTGVYGPIAAGNPFGKCLYTDYIFVCKLINRYK